MLLFLNSFPIAGLFRTCNTETRNINAVCPTHQVWSGTRHPAFAASHPKRDIRYSRHPLTKMAGLFFFLWFWTTVDRVAPTIDHVRDRAQRPCLCQHDLQVGSNTHPAALHPTESRTQLLQLANVELVGLQHFVHELRRRGLPEDRRCGRLPPARHFMQQI